MAPAAIRGEVQLLVEGNDERNFFEAFAEHLALGNVQTQVFGGKINCARSSRCRIVPGSSPAGGLR